MVETLILNFRVFTVKLACVIRCRSFLVTFFGDLFPEITK